MWLSCALQALVNIQVNSSMSTRGQHVCVATTVEGATLLCWMGYTLGFATHF